MTLVKQLMWTLIYLIVYKEIQTEAEKPKESHSLGHGVIMQQSRELLIVTNSDINDRY